MREKMRDRKRRWEIFSFFEYTGVARHLEKMAEKGWLIEKISNFGWTYRRIEPKKLTFFVSYYPGASEFDPEPTKGQKEFCDFCEHTGWVRAASFAQMQIFYNERENPTPIETDPALEIETIHAAAKKSYLPSYFLLLLLSVANGVLFAVRFLKDPIEVLSGAANLFTGVAWLLLFLTCVAELSGYFVWHAKAQKAARLGEFIESPAHSRRQKALLGLVLLCFAYWFITIVLLGDPMMRTVGVIMLFYMALLVVLINGIKMFLKRRKAPRALNRGVTIFFSFALGFLMMGVIVLAVLQASRRGFFEEEGETYEYNGAVFTAYRDELPLTVEDLLKVSCDGYSSERRDTESLLLEQHVAQQWPRFDAEQFAQLPSLEYTVVEVRLSFLYDFCKDSFLNERKDQVADGRVVFAEHYESSDPSPWRAREAYRLYWSDGYQNRYLLCYEKRIVEMVFSWEPTEEQMGIVADKLAGERAV